MLTGAGSVAVSARPSLPTTLTTSGWLRMILSDSCNRRLASVTVTLGSVVGM